MARWYRLAGVDAPFDASHRFETSWAVPPFVLFLIRALISLYAFVTIFFSLGWESTHGQGQEARRSFSYFTDLNYWGLAFYFLFAAIHTFTYARSGRAALDRWPRPLQALHSLLYTTVVTYPFFVTSALPGAEPSLPADADESAVVFWVILYAGGWFRVYAAWSNVSKHAMNAAFALFELVFARTSPPPWLHLPLLVVLLALYVGLAFVTFAAQGFYPYDFLDDRVDGRGRVAAYVFGLLAAVIVVFVVVWLSIWSRTWLTERVLGLTGKVHAGRTGRRSDVEMSRPAHKDALPPS
ncbi:MAG: hypothetical protein M1833_002465 [Piccolia ochrophora]|nr:MAG: hypothetical protein M1833_002465 [Piccolia ochrophora]